MPGVSVCRFDLHQIATHFFNLFGDVLSSGRTDPMHSLGAPKRHRSEPRTPGGWTLFSDGCNLSRVIPHPT